MAGAIPFGNVNLETVGYIRPVVPQSLVPI
jgi:hypothetical protein